MTCSYPECPKPRDGKKLLCAMHYQRKRRGIPMDAPFYLVQVRHCVNPWHLEPVTVGVNNSRSIHPKVTHCRHGHLYDEANTRITNKGSRACRACNRARHVLRAKAKTEAAKP